MFDALPDPHHRADLRIHRPEKYPRDARPPQRLQRSGCWHRDVGARSGWWAQLCSYVYATEVPLGYERLSFQVLRPDQVARKGNKEAVPREVQALDSQTVFIKGYIRPGTHVSKGGTPVRNNVSRFLLVRDSNECCFGDISTVKYYDKMLVQLTNGLNTDYSSGMFRVGGKLRIVPADPRAGRPEPAYLLEADYVK